MSKTRTTLSDPADMAGQRPKYAKGRPKSETRGNLRGHVVEVTRQMLQTMRPVRVTKGAIAERAGIDPKLLNYYFGSVDAVLVEVLDGMIRELQDRIVAVSRQHGTPAMALKRRIGALIDFLIEYPAFSEMLIANVYYGESDWARKSLHALTIPAFEGISRLVERAREDGQMRSDFDTRLLYTAIIAMTVFMSTGRPVFDILYKPADGTVVERYKAFVFKLIMQGIGTTSAARCDDASAPPLRKAARAAAARQKGNA